MIITNLHTGIGEGDMRRRTGGGRVCWEMLHPCWQWCANRCDNSKQCWDLQCIVGKVWPIRLWRQCVMQVRGFNNVGRAAQTDPKLLRHASTITKQKKCWELLAQKFDRFQTLRTHNNMQQGVQVDATCIIQQCWELLGKKVVSFCTGLYLAKKKENGG